MSSTALVLSARHGQRGQGTTSIGRGLYVERLTAGSTTAARKCLLITRKIIIPSPDSRDPPDGPPVFREKKRLPLTARTHWTGQRISQKNVPPAVSSNPPEVPPYYAQKNEYPLLAGTHLGGRLTCGPTKLTGTEGFVNLVNINDSSSSDRTMSIQRPCCFFNI